MALLCGGLREAARRVETAVHGDATHFKKDRIDKYSITNTPQLRDHYTIGEVGLPHKNFATEFRIIKL